MSCVFGTRSPKQRASTIERKPVQDDEVLGLLQQAGVDEPSLGEVNSPRLWKTISGLTPASWTACTAGIANCLDVRRHTERRRTIGSGHGSQTRRRSCRSGRLSSRRTSAVGHKSALLLTHEQHRKTRVGAAIDRRGQFVVDVLSEELHEILPGGLLPSGRFRPPADEPLDVLAAADVQSRCEVTERMTSASHFVFVAVVTRPRAGSARGEHQRQDRLSVLTGRRSQRRVAQTEIPASVQDRRLASQPGRGRRARSFPWPRRRRLSLARTRRDVFQPPLIAHRVLS
jgi:hypothetical protein